VFLLNAPKGKITQRYLVIGTLVLPLSGVFMIKLSNNITIVRAKAIFNDGHTEGLHKRLSRDGKPNKNLFFKDIYRGDLIIRFRIDWGFLDSNNDPFLDAAIFKNNKNKEKYEVPADQWEKLHNTSRAIQNGKYIYVWKPDIKDLNGFVIEIQLEVAAQQPVAAILTTLEKAKP
jgi:hypothetical protein